MNRSKRKRFYRMSKRQEELWNMNRRYHDVERLRKFGKAEDESYFQGLITEIYKTDSVNNVMFESFTYGMGSRVDYIKDLMGKYAYEMTGLDESENMLNIIAWYPDKTPMTPNERIELQAFLLDFFGGNTYSIKIAYGVTNHYNSELQIQIISIKN